MLKPLLVETIPVGIVDAESSIGLEDEVVFAGDRNIWRE